jgi:hypothetical protein
LEEEKSKAKWDAILLEREFEKMDKKGTEYFINEVEMPKNYLEGVDPEHKLVKPIEMANFFFREASKLARYAVGSVEKLENLEKIHSGMGLIPTI